MLAAGVALPTTAADASPPTSALFSISWSGNANCHPTDDVVEGVRRYIGGVPDSVLSVPFTVEARVDTRSPNEGWTLTLMAVGPRGTVQRELVVGNCDDVATATSLVLSLWIQSAKQSAQSADTESTPIWRDGVAQLPGGEASVYEPPPIAISVRRDESRVEVRRIAWTTVAVPRLRVQFALGAVAFTGPLPRLGSGWLGRVGMSYGAWRGDTMLVWLNSQEQRSVAHPSFGGTFGFEALGIRVAQQWALTERLNIQPGLWSMIGRLSAKSLGTMVQPTAADGYWGAAGLALDGELRLGAVRLALGGGCGLPFGRPHYTLGGDVLYRTAAVAAFAQLTLGTAFP